MKNSTDTRKNNIYSYFIYYRVMINSIEQGCGDLLITTDTKIEDLKTIEKYFSYD